MTKFKKGDKVVFVEPYNVSHARPIGIGDTATVTGYYPGRMNLVQLDLTSGNAKGTQTECFDSRVKLAEKPALTLNGFTVGDKVRYTGSSADWQGVEGIIETLQDKSKGIHNHRVKLLSAPKGTGWYKSVGDTANLNPRDLEVVKELKPFTYEDIQVGDTIRRTATFDDGATEVREGTVAKEGSYYRATANNYILAYHTDTDKEDVTLELVNRLQPPKKKEIWEDAPLGTVIKRGSDYVILNEKGWGVLYGDGSFHQFDKDAASSLVGSRGTLVTK